MAYCDITFPDDVGKAIGRYYRSTRFAAVVDALANREDEDAKTVMQDFAGATFRVDYVKGDVRSDLERVDD